MQTPIRIECTGFDSAPLAAFRELQGELKSLSLPDYQKLRGEILKRGFSFPVAVWVDKESGTLWLLDGHQRLRTLKKMRDEGFEIPLIPYVAVNAASLQEAKAKLLGAASQFGKMESQGLYEFLEGSGIDIAELVGQFRFPELDLAKFAEEFYTDPQSDPGNIGNVAPDQAEAPTLSPGEQIPSAEARTTAAPEAHVRQVQLFFDGAQHAEFLEKVTKLQEHYGRDNLTDAIMEVVRADHQSKFPS